jgi:hypothetical protein
MCGCQWFRGVPHYGYMRNHRTWGMILVDLDESYQNIHKIYIKSSHIARKKVVLLWAQKSCFFTFASKTHLGQAKSGKIDLCYTTSQGLPESPSYDLPFV